VEQTRSLGEPVSGSCLNHQTLLTGRLGYIIQRHSSTWKWNQKGGGWRRVARWRQPGLGPPEGLSGVGSDESVFTHDGWPLSDGPDV